MSVFIWMRFGQISSLDGIAFYLSLVVKTFISQIITAVVRSILNGDFALTFITKFVRLFFFVPWKLSDDCNVTLVARKLSWADHLFTYGIGSGIQWRREYATGAYKHIFYVNPLMHLISLTLWWKSILISSQVNPVYATITDQSLTEQSFFIPIKFNSDYLT